MVPMIKAVVEKIAEGIHGVDHEIVANMGISESMLFVLLYLWEVAVKLSPLLVLTLMIFFENMVTLSLSISFTLTIFSFWYGRGTCQRMGKYLCSTEYATKNGISTRDLVCYRG